jgi:hypothetical protein
MEIFRKWLESTLILESSFFFCSFQLYKKFASVSDYLLINYFAGFVILSAVFFLANRSYGNFSSFHTLSLDSFFLLSRIFFAGLPILLCIYYGFPTIQQVLLALAVLAFSAIMRFRS